MKSYNCLSIGYFKPIDELDYKECIDCFQFDYREMYESIRKTSFIIDDILISELIPLSKTLKSETDSDVQNLIQKYGCNYFKIITTRDFSDAKMSDSNKLPLVKNQSVKNFNNPNYQSYLFCEN